MNHPGLKLGLDQLKFEYDEEKERDEKTKRNFISDSDGE